MITEKQFWIFIEQSIQEKQSEDKNEQGDALMELLEKQPLNQIVGFHTRMVMLREELKSPLMKDIAFMMKFGDNNHAYEGFRNWVISLGEEHYQKAKNSPTYLLTLKDPSLFIVNQAYFQDLNYVASGAYFAISDEDKGVLEWEELVRKDNRALELNNDRDKDNGLEI